MHLDSQTDLETYLNNPSDQSRELATAISAAKSGAEILTQYFADLGSAEIQTKQTGDQYQGIVTQADVEAERAIVAEIKKTFPDHEFLGEEEHSASADAEHLWVIDPLDGTNNFAHGIPHFAVSIAYYRNGKAHCGVIIDPCRNDTFTTERGEGAFWHKPDGTRIRASVNQHARFEDTMIAVGFYYDRGPMMQATLAATEELFQQNIHGIRRFGTAALDLVSVGIGRYGGYFEYKLSPWDFAAAQLFVTEAGGMVTTCSGDPLGLNVSTVLATNSRLHQQILPIVKKHGTNLL